MSEVSNHWWYSMLILPPLLKDSVAAPLLSAYYPDCVGMSPSCTSTHRAASDASPGKLEHSKAVPCVLGESWSWPSPLSLLPPPLPWKYVGEQNGKDFLFLMCAACYKAPHYFMDHYFMVSLWIARIICIYWTVNFALSQWEGCNTCPGIMPMEFNEHLFESWIAAII